MRVLSVVFILSTLAIFGEIGEALRRCQVACKSSLDTQDLVCLSINGRNLTTDSCAHNNIKTCLSEKIQNTGITVELLQKSACDIDEKNACYNVSCKGKTLYPVCDKLGTKIKRHTTLCAFLVDLNCYDLREGRNSKNQLLNFGECNPNSMPTDS